MNQKITVIGGGTGTFTVLSGLKSYSYDLNAIVSMADDGGSTGQLRNELGVLPPGDVRQCLVALSNSDRLMNELMNHRFDNGHLSGHSFGNLLLSALEQITGSFDKAIEKTSEILNVQGKVIPVTLDKVALIAEFKNNKIVRGEHTIDEKSLKGLKKLYLNPPPKPNKKAISAIKSSDLIVIGPGDLFSSIIPNLLVKGITKAIKESRGKRLLVCNLMNKRGHTDNFSVMDYVNTIESYLKHPLDYVIFNSSLPTPKLIKFYKKDGQEMVSVDFEKIKQRCRKNTTEFLSGDILNLSLFKPKKGDKIKRSLIRHDSKKLAELIISVLN